jgi:putative ABC transport system permease protein
MAQPAQKQLYAVINIFGLTAGLTACLLIGVYIIHELSYDKFNTMQTASYGQQWNMDRMEL